jgi:hypothetical protein
VIESCWPLGGWVPRDVAGLLAVNGTRTGGGGHPGRDTTCLRHPRSVFAQYERQDTAATLSFLRNRFDKPPARDARQTIVGPDRGAEILRRYCAGPAKRLFDDRMIKPQQFETFNGRRFVAIIGEALGQLSERLDYDRLYQAAISDPELRRTKVELEAALANASEATC